MDSKLYFHLSVHLAFSQAINILDHVHTVIFSLSSLHCFLEFCFLPLGLY